MANRLISNLSGGINAGTAPLIIKDTECELIKNYNLDTLGALTKRKGFQYWGSKAYESMASYATTAIAQYTNINTSSRSTQIAIVGTIGGSQRPYMMVSTTLNGAITTASTSVVLADATNFGTSGNIEIEGDIITYTGKTSNTLTGATGISASHANTTAVRQWRATHTGVVTTVNKSNLLTFLDYCFWFNDNGCLSTNNPTVGGAWGTTNFFSGASAFGEVFQDRIYTANWNDSRLLFSSLPSSADVITWDTTNDWVGINPDDGDKITGLKTAGNRLLIFKNNGTYTWKYGLTQPDKLFDIGTSSDKSVQNQHGITFFANRFGVYAWAYDSMAQPKLISRKVQKWIDAISSANYSLLNAGVDNRHYYLWIGNVTVDGASYTDVVLVYHIFENAWTVYTNIPAACWTTIADGNNNYVLFGGGYPVNNLSGAFRFDVNTNQPSSTSTETAIPIDGEIISKEYLLSFPNKTKLNEIHSISSQRVNANVSLSLDRENDFFPLTDMKERFNKFIVPAKAKKDCNSIRLKITDNSENTSIIEGFNFNHEVTEKT